MDRYAGKPFLRLVECYVLEAIGQLDEAQRDSLREMEPKLRNLYGVQGSWIEIVSSQMEFPPSLPAQIKEIWEKGLVRATEQGMQVDPNEFAMAFVDKNFPA
ncbi:hypothetical protein [Luteimonas panaciterrae]|uniref:hypothetical protein n=1 Tax=Luteimonas panaciterrae TaxID=363885 RepID=UPI001CFB0AA3|nr:hypothetical protein [Luteimonas panaciterrae]